MPAPERVACVWLPQFAVWAERARRPDSGGPLALVGREEGKEAVVVRAGSPEAEAAGLSPGTPAHMIPQQCPGALILPFDARCYGQAYEELLDGLDAVTPEIEAQPLEVFYLELSGLPHLDAEDPEQVGEAVRAVIPSPFRLRIGLASGKFTAWVAANLAPPGRPLSVADEARARFLKEAPSTLLPVDAEAARRLDLLGLRTLGRIARLPRSAMLAQFGWQGDRIHRLACGEDREPLVPYVRPPVIRETLVFPMPAPTVTQFELALSRLLERAWGRPERRGRGVRQVRLLAQMESGDVWERALTLRRPSEDWLQIFGELRRRLESARPAGALTELTLELTAFAARLDCQRLLFPDERQHRREALAYELDQLWERLGHSSVFRIVETEPWSRLPERQYSLLSCDT